MNRTAPLEARCVDRTGPTFLHALAALGGLPGPDASRGDGDAFSRRLAGWFDWKDAVRLSAALGGAADHGAATDVLDRSRLAADERECARVRDVLASRVADATADRGRAEPCAVASNAGPPPLVRSADTDLAFYRQRHAACQQAMDTQVGTLRRRLRATLAAGPPRLARLAEIDAVMEQVVGPRERTLLAGVAGRLETHFEQLRQVHPPTDDAEARPWVAPFRQAMQTLLLAELELRLQPACALLAAGRSKPAPFDG